MLLTGNRTWGACSDTLTTRQHWPRQESSFWREWSIFVSPLPSFPCTPPPTVIWLPIPGWNLHWAGPCRSHLHLIPLLRLLSPLTTVAAFLSFIPSRTVGTSFPYSMPEMLLCPQFHLQLSSPFCLLPVQSCSFLSATADIHIDLSPRTC